MATDELAILDDIRIAHELRRVLWQEFGERSVPEMGTGGDGYFVKVRGTDGDYFVSIRRVDATENV